MQRVLQLLLTCQLRPARRVRPAAPVDASPARLDFESTRGATVGHPPYGEHIHALRPLYRSLFLVIRALQSGDRLLGHPPSKPKSCQLVEGDAGRQVSVSPPTVRRVPAASARFAEQAKHLAAFKLQSRQPRSSARRRPADAGDELGPDTVRTKAQIIDLRPGLV